MAEYPNDVIRTIEERSSARVFTSEPLTEEERAILTSAALRAPNGGKMSKFSLIDVRDQAIKDRLAVLCDNQPFVAKAPGVYVILADFDRWFRLFRKYVGTLGVHINYPHEDEILFSIVDAALAAENMAIAGESIGVGSCFIADVVTHHDEIREMLNLPQYVMPIMLGIFGHPVSKPKQRSARIGVSVVHRDRYEPLRDDQMLDMIDPLIPRGADGAPVMTPEDYVTRYYIRRLGSWLSFERTNSVRAMFRDWLKSPFGDE